jgi:phosphotransferase system enzyme I (PtsI)
VKICGIAASDGIAIAKVYKMHHNEIVVRKRDIAYVDRELDRFEKAVSKSIDNLESLRKETEENIDQEHAEIFNAHIQILKDPEFVGAVKTKVETERVNAEYALKEISDQFVAIFLAMDNAYMRERVADIEDVTKRLLMTLLGIKGMDLTSIEEEVIVVAHDLSPSDTAQMNKNCVKGFVTNIGGCTSHSAIIARTLEIPAVVGAKDIFDAVEDGDLIILDGINGQVITDPSQVEIEAYQEKALAYENKKAVWAKFIDKPSVSLDGHEVELAANIASINDVDSVIGNGGDGIGLFRTEFLYMGRTNLPSEEEQFEAYKKVLKAMDGKPVVIRTLDIGGDKEVSYLKIPKELNPFLGYRAIRLCLDRPEIFKTQLRALLRASIHGNLKIMFPMIATINEFRQAKTILMDAKKDLLDSGFEVSADIEVGIMVEIPSAAISANQFAKEVDFFSIGTNDLIQYTFAADRMNEAVSYLYQPFNPSLLRLIKMVVDAAHGEGKWVGMCGEMAGTRMALPILLGLGLDEFSMNASGILPARQMIGRLNQKEMSVLARKALNMSTSEEVLNLIEEHIKEDM